MILVCTGTQKFPFDRLLSSVDTLAGDGTITEEVTAQTGWSDYVMRHCAHKPFFDQAGMDALMKKADLVITHGGSGTIMQALLLGKKVIAVPRDPAYGEHIDSHQRQIVEALAKAGHLLACPDPGKLKEAIAEARRTDFVPYLNDPRAVAKDMLSYLEGALSPSSGQKY